MTESEGPPKAAHKHSFRNKDEVIASEICGCFGCLKIYTLSEIKIWNEEKSTYDGIEDFTAICPYCGMDTVISSKSGFPIEHDFLIEMQKRWCPTEEQWANGNYEIIESGSFSELFYQLGKHNNEK